MLLPAVDRDMPAVGAEKLLPAVGAEKLLPAAVAQAGAALPPASDLFCMSRRIGGYNGYT